MIYIRKEGRIISRSKNLRGITRYRSQPDRAHILGLADGGALLRVRFKDGAYSVAKFASVDVCRRWCQARRAPGLFLARYSPVWGWCITYTREG